jgi:hypothetical protein
MLPVSTQGAPLAGECLDRRVLKKELPVDAANGTSDRSFWLSARLVIEQNLL